MRSAETFEEAREKADQTARELSDRLSAPYEEVRKHMVIEPAEPQSISA